MIHINDLINTSYPIMLAKGKASYKMDRGSFTTKDKITNKHYLKFVSEANGVYLYKDNELTCKMFVTEENEQAVIKFEVSDPSFNRFEVSFNSDKNEKIYGCGEQFTHLNLKGQLVPIWVSEHQQAMKIAKKFLREKVFGVNPAYKPKYKNHQTYFASNVFTSSKKYFVDVDCDVYGHFNFLKEKTVIAFREIPKSIKFIFADSFEELSLKVANHLGYQRKIPSWVGDGIIVACQGGSEKLLEKLKKAEEHNMKLAGFWCQDWSGNVVTSFGYQVFWNWEANFELYKDLDKLIDNLHAKGIKYLGYINTFLKENARLYNEAKEKGYLVKHFDDSVYLIKSTTFDAGIVDLTNPEAFEWYKNVIKVNMIDFGLDGWMADFGEYLPTDAKCFGGNAEELHNLWPTLWARCNYEAISERNKEGEIFIFNRAAYKTSVPYMFSMWNGDQHVDFSDEYGLGSVVCASLSLANSGVGIVHSDIGGYTTVLHMKRNSELMIRWAELNAFTPIFRGHEGNRPWSNVQFDDDSVIDKLATLSHVFANLKPYYDFLYEKYYNEATPIMLPLYYYNDEEWCYTNKEEYLLGKDVLVSPVVRPNCLSKKVRLPQGNWVQFFTNEKYSGGEIEVDTPLGMPIAFYKEDSKFANLFKNLRGE